jgi:hypothetical protein
VRYTRLYTDASGDSRFEEVEVESFPADFGVQGAPMDLSSPFDATRTMFVSIPPGWHGERHNAPARQFFVQLTGVIEAEVADGQRFRTGPGSITLIEDTNGSGHATRVIGDVPVTGARVQLPD